MSNKFQSYFLHEPSRPDAKAVRAWQLAEQYHAECDLYDEDVCSGRDKKTGEALPANNDERIAILRNSSETKARLAAEAGMSESEFGRVCHDVIKRRRV